MTERKIYGYIMTGLAGTLIGLFTGGYLAKKDCSPKEVYKTSVRVDGKDTWVSESIDGTKVPFIEFSEGKLKRLDQVQAEDTEKVLGKDKK